MIVISKEIFNSDAIPSDNVPQRSFDCIRGSLARDLIVQKRRKIITAWWTMMMRWRRRRWWRRRCMDHASWLKWWLCYRSIVFTEFMMQMPIVDIVQTIAVNFSDGVDFARWRINNNCAKITDEARFGYIPWVVLVKVMKNIFENDPLIVDMCIRWSLGTFTNIWYTLPWFEPPWIIWR